MKTLYVDMDNTLVDFSARLATIHPPVVERYGDSFDEIPGLFAMMPPVEGAIEAFTELSKIFDAYILSTAPWGNPSAWQHKAEWVRAHFGAEKDSPAYKRLIITHHKNLNVGDFLVDDRPTHNGAGKFAGEVIPFGHQGFENWEKVVAYLRNRA